MSTKTSTQGTNTNATAFNFDPAAMGAYRQNIGNLMPFLTGNMLNPFGSQAFQQESTIATDQAGNLGRRNLGNVLANANALGYGTGTGLFNTMLQNASMGTSALQSQGFRGAIGNAVGRQMTSAGMLSQFQPLMTGSNSSGNFSQSQTQSGLGTWLPQLAGAVGGAAMNAFMPGIGSAMKGPGSLSNLSSPSMINSPLQGSPSFGGVMGGFPGMNSGGMSGLNSLFGYGYGSTPNAAPMYSGVGRF